MHLIRRGQTKGKGLLSAERILACSILADDTHIYLSGIVGATMKQ